MLVTSGDGKAEWAALQPKYSILRAAKFQAACFVFWRQEC